MTPLEEKIFKKEKTKPKKIILLAGPTACGKTALSLLLSEMLGGEIISADSAQVYRGMDIGTAKATPEERARVPHYLIDIRHIQESFNVVDFFYEAKQACESILARDRVPIVVGGSGFYFRALLHGPPPGPPSIPDVRRTLEQEMEERGQEALFQKVLELDPEYAKTITKNDKQKIIRALEIITISGKKVSDLDWKRNKQLPDYIYHSWFLYRPRKILYERIDERCEKMVAEGLIEEVKALEKQGLRSNRSAAQAIGYRQALDFLDTPQSKEDFENFLQKFKTASHHYAKRQFTWFRKEPSFRWLNVEAHDFEIAADMICQDYSQIT